MSLSLVLLICCHRETQERERTRVIHLETEKAGVFTKLGQHSFGLLQPSEMGIEINRFQGEVDEELLCPICSSVLENPLQVYTIRSLKTVIALIAKFGREGLYVMCFSLPGTKL